MEPQQVNNPSAASGNVNTDNPINQSVQPNNSLTVISMALFILMSLGIIIFLYYQNQQLKNMLASYQSQPTASPTPTATPDPTANWKTYTNTKLTYSVKYPSDWKITLGDNGVTTNFNDPSAPEFISITVQDNPKLTEVHQWLIDKSIIPNPNNIATHIQTEDIVITGMNSVKVITPVNGGQYTVYIPMGNKIYSLYNNIGSTAQSSSEGYIQNVKILNQLISTFKFLPTSSPSPSPVGY